MQLLSTPLNDHDNKVASFIWSTWAKFADKGQLFWPKYDQRVLCTRTLPFSLARVMTRHGLFHQHSKAFFVGTTGCFKDLDTNPWIHLTRFCFWRQKNLVKWRHKYRSRGPIVRGFNLFFALFVRKL